jgi:hypothetical protein
MDGDSTEAVNVGVDSFGFAATAFHQPIDAKADRKNGKAGAGDRTRGGVNSCWRNRSWQWCWP